MLAAALVVVPGPYGSSFAGPPLGASGRVALAIVFGSWLWSRFLPSARGPAWRTHALLLGLVALKVLLAAVSVPAGWRGQYAFLDQRGQWHSAEFFWRFSRHRFRIDPTPALPQPASDLHFLNDIPSYGYPPYSAVRRDVEFPLTVTWTGYVDVDAALPVRLSGTSAGALTAQIDGRDAGALNARDLVLAPGEHVIRIRYDKPAGEPPRVAALLTGTGTGRSLVVAPRPGPAPTTRPVAPLGSALVWIGLGLAASAFVHASLRRPWRSSANVVAALGLASSALVIVWTLRLAIAMLGVTLFLHGGGDPLVYASDARDILLHGLLNLRGAEVGQAQPFYHYPFYPYLLAAAHALVGDDGSTIFLVNGFALALLPWLFWRLGWRALSPVAAVWAFASLVAFIAWYCWPIAAFEEPSFTDVVFVALVFAAVVGLARAYDSPTPGRLLCAGILTGIGCATRPSLAIFVPMAAISMWWWVGRALGRWIAAGTWFAAGVLGALLPFAVRNLLAARQVVLLVNSWIQIPYFLVPPEAPVKPGLEAGIPGLGQSLRLAGAIVMSDPAGALWVETRKLLFTLGWAGFGPAGLEGHTALVILPALFVVAAWRCRIPRNVLAAVAVFALSHIAAMIVAAPWTYHLKSILPLHAAFLFGSAYLLEGSRPRRRVGS